MFRRICSIVVLLGLLLCGLGVDVGLAQKTVRVRGYTRKDGTYVRPHTRSAPGSKGIYSAVRPVTPRDSLLLPAGTYNVTSQANLRSGPSINSARLAVVPSGGAITVDECEAGWCAANYQGQAGFINQSLIPTSAMVSARTNDGINTTCLVEAVPDGDTITCRDGNQVRLLLIDAPEINQGAFGLEAKNALAGIVPVGSMVQLEFDTERRDSNRRVLAYVYTRDGRMANEEMARAGYAVTSVQEPNVMHVERIRAAAAEAQEQRRGLWSTSAFECSPAHHRDKKCE